MNKNVIVTLETTKETMERIQQNYISFMLPSSGQEYILFHAKKNDLMITAYQSKKSTLCKIVFQGPSAKEEAKKYENQGTLHFSDDKSSSYDDTNTQVGSDEVGVGDFFGPIVVCAVYIKKEDFSLIEESGITDSKKLSDQKIMEIVPSLLSHFTYSFMVLSAQKYNEMVHKGFNLNKLKAWLHNQALYNVAKKEHHIHPIYVDQFCEERLYYRYLEDAKDVVTNITFKTKGETHYPSVALASCFARYRFLLYMQELSKKLGEEIPLGASKSVTEFAYRYYVKKGDSFLENFTKTNFKNYKEIKER